MALEISETAKYITDGVSIFTLAATLVAILPAIAAFLTIVWTTIRILETETVKGWLVKYHDWRTRRKETETSGG